MFTQVSYDYLPIVIFFIVACGLAVLMSLLPYLTTKRLHNKHKLAPYECGFEAFGNTRTTFDIRFYLVAILFIIFDLEIAFLFPWALGLSISGTFGFWSMMWFLLILAIGFIYEWKKGALEWE